ncbi:MAG TPA: acyl-ACP--UDP-N-acetylglucosamine O-acyltransferase [Methylomirabilota bacterium]
MADTKIHPSALVDPAARLGSGVAIGPFSIVGPEVTLGDGVVVAAHAILEGPVVIGAGASIGPGSVLGGLPQDLKFKPGTVSGVRVGARTVLREYVTVHRASTPDAWTEIGEDCLIMGMAHVAHDCRVGNGVIIINYAGLTGHCEIGDRATVGGLTGLVPFARVGEYAYLGGGSKVNHDVPPYTMVDGSPATARAINVVGLRRGGMPPADRRVLRDAYRLLYRSGLTPPAALERVRKELPATEPVKRLVEFVEASRKGICPPAGGWRTPVDDDDDGGEDEEES